MTVATDAGIHFLTGMFICVTAQFPVTADDLFRQIVSCYLELRSDNSLLIGLNIVQYHDAEPK